MRKWLSALALALLLLPLGCHSAPQVSFDALVSNPATYDGKTVTVDGYYFSGFEINALAGSLVPASQPGNLKPQGTLIWVTPSVGTDVQSQLYSQQNTPSGYTEYYGKLRLKGVFGAKGGYGQLGSYQYQLSIVSADVLSWVPTTAVATS